MRIAIACEGLHVAPRYEYCESYMCYTVDHGVIVDGQNMPSPGVNYREIADTLYDIGVRVLIVGAIDASVAELFCAKDIDVIANAKGEARRVLDQYLTDELIGVDDLCNDEEYDDEDGEDDFINFE
ncbi:MAG: NifB/NifX family molybdenum-iron cluster-binding protein [Eggerthellaceae bacterium]|nr:NifB/NifX family molybdenum-iron cluster-binding protein [Eggerthellaceae bacterium]